MIGFNLKKVGQWIGDTAKNTGKWIGDNINKAKQVVKDITNFPKFIIDAVILYNDILKKSIVKNGKPVLDALSYIGASISSRAYEWFGNKRRVSSITIKGKKLDILHDDEHGVAYEDDSSVYLAYRGTEPNFKIKAKGSIERTISDLLTDLNIALGKGASTGRINQAISFYKKVKSMTDKPIVLITGHSLGGYIAKMVHIKVAPSTKTIVFNAAAHPNDKRAPNLTIHKVIGDPVSTFSGVSTSKRYLYKMNYKYPNIGAHSLNLFL